MARDPACRVSDCRLHATALSGGGESLLRWRAKGGFMKRCLVALAAVVVCLVPLRADVTLTQTTTMQIEGPMAAMMPAKPMVMVTRIKGTKARADVEMMDQKISSLADLTTKELTVLNHQQKTAQVISTTAVSPAEIPKLDVDVSFKPTGQSKAIDGVPCAEYAFKMTFGFAEMSAGQMPKETGEMMKDVRMVMDGSTWIARTGPGSEEYIKFQKASMNANMAAILGGIMGGPQRGGIDKLMAAISEAPGLAYLTEMSMSVDGTGPMVDMFKQQLGGMKVTQKMTSVSTEAIADDLFKVPPGYTIKK
jgi:hypothetical protein